jgi:hypothetical protein
MNSSRRKALLLGGVVAGVFATQARADTAFTGFAFPATGRSANRTDPDRWADIFNVLDYGADRTGASDSAPAINAAVAAMYGTSTKGGTVFFPPGTYKVLSQINLAGVGASTGRFTGAGCNASIIQGTIANDFVVRLDDQSNGVQEISDLSIVNLSTTIGSGALVYVQPFGVLRNLSLLGNIGLWSGWNEFVSTITGIEVQSGGAQGSVGLVISGSTVMGCHSPGLMETGLAATGTACNISDIHIENAIVGMRLGYFIGVATSCTMTSSGTSGVLTVGGTTYPNPLSSIVPIQVGDQIVATGIASTITVTVASLGTGTGGTGTYNVTSTGGNVPALSSAQAITFRRKQTLTASTISNYECEAVGIAMALHGMSGCVIGPCNLTSVMNQAPTLGGINTGSPQCAMLLLSVGQTVFNGVRGNISCAQAAFQFGTSDVFQNVVFNSCFGNTTPAAVTDTNAFIDNGAGAGSPSGVAGNVLTVKAGLTNTIGILGVVSGSGVPTGSSAPLIANEVGFPVGSYSNGGPNKSYVLTTRAGGAISLNITGVALTVTHGSAWGVDNQTPLSGMNSNNKASFAFVNCNNPTLGMTFASLPGQSGVQAVGPTEGQEYNIVDDNSAGTFGATSSGGGSRHAKIRYNGTNWTVCGT